MAIWDHIYAAPHMKKRPSMTEQWRALGLGELQGLYQEIVAGAKKYPNTKLVFGSETRPSESTTGQMIEQIDHVADGLHALGLRAGDVLVFQMPNWSESMAAFMAALKLGLVLVPVVHIYGPSELEFILRVTKARALMLPDRWRKIDYAARVAALKDLPDLKHVIVLGDGPMPRPVVRWPELLKTTVKAPAHPSKATDIAMMNFTSGTTADPKGAVHCHGTLIVETHFLLPGPGPGFDTAAGDMMFWAGPGGHISSITANMRPFLTGEGAVYVDQFDGALLLDLMARFPIRRLGGAPFAVSFLLDHAPKHLLDKMNAVGSGGAGVPPKLVYRAQELGIPMIRSYGSTEHPTVTGAEYNDPLEQRANTDGRLLAGCQLRIVDDDGKELPIGEAGEIETTGPELFLGYLDPKLNETSFAPDGWFKTGDIGVMNDAGFLTIVDRKKDIIIRGGENISSKEVEDILARHPSVSEAAVVAWPDEVYGERVGAFVIPRPGKTVDIASIAEHFQAAGVAKQKTPERLVVVEDFPRTPYGKVLKRDLRRRVPANA